ncbi:uncharacterized protein LOC126849884 [Cataglyphis hispanica]|uniref:uncharacterized protein LOC126849884 n=1 Tax=Cataglyphis hispanica TaxID=1086592 RepID=UPI0021807CB7|nr:uncharacterized protein LOC126849884 [Cataglyphis hispanica]
MATIMCLPEEVITIILGYNDITVEDIINFRCVCKQFQWVGKFEKYKEKKFLQRWPSAKKSFDKYCKENEQRKSKGNEQEMSKENEQKNKKDFIKIGLFYARELQNYVSKIVNSHYGMNKTIDNLIKFDYIFNENPYLINDIVDIVYQHKSFIKYSFFIDEIKNLLTQSPRITGCDLTKRYCNIKLFYFMRQCFVKKKLIRYISQPYETHLLERTATLVAQLFQPEKDIFYSNIKKSLDDIKLDVLRCLRIKHPNHSIFSTSPKILSYWENCNIINNYWNEAERIQIMDILKEYIFSKFQLRRWKMSSNAKLENMCIDNVLKNKCGHELILLIIYHSVARKLGLRCDVIRLGYYFSHFFILWKPNYITSSIKNMRCFNISSKEICPFYHGIKYRDEEPTSIQSNFVYIDELRTGQFWKQLLWLDFGFMLDGSIHLIENNKTNALKLSVEKTKLYTRPEDVKFAVGMIVVHQPANCAGVIVGWHQHLDRHRVTISIKCLPGPSCMHMCELTHYRNTDFIKKQTNYIILTENNKMCYVEEDTITLTAPRWIDNSEIGRYFCKFEGTHYVPNKMLARLYPQDAAITATLKYN